MPGLAPALPRAMVSEPSAYSVATRAAHLPSLTRTAPAHVFGSEKHTCAHTKAVTHLTCSSAAARAGAGALHARPQQAATHSNIPHTSTLRIEPSRIPPYVGKAEAAQGRCAAPQEEGADEQAREAEQRRRAGGSAGRASEARPGEAGGAGGMRFQDAGFGGLHPHNAEVAIRLSSQVEQCLACCARI